MDKRSRASTSMGPHGIRRSDDARPDTGNAAARKKKPGSILEHVQEEAVKRAERGRDEHPNPHRKEDVLVRKTKEMSEEDAREMAFQAAEQMRTLKEVSTRVQHALSKAQDLDIDNVGKNTADNHHQQHQGDKQPPGDAKRWISESRRLINGAMFRYNESCEERNEALTGFCNWFELYENVWPLPLVSNDVQYDVLVGKEKYQNQNDEEDYDKIHELWPHVTKMRQDLSQIMSLTTDMGQKALNADLCSQIESFQAKISEKSAEIDGLEKKLRAEKESLKFKDQEMIKLRQMSEVQIKRRYVCACLIGGK
jgi:hypothetical protein